jgi:hypothetical protein
MAVSRIFLSEVCNKWFAKPRATHLHASAVIIMCVLSMLWMKLGGKALRCLDFSHWQLSGELFATTWQQQQHRQGQQQCARISNQSSRPCYRTGPSCTAQLHAALISATSLQLVEHASQAHAAANMPALAVSDSPQMTVWQSVC